MENHHQHVPASAKPELRPLEQPARNVPVSSEPGEKMLAYFKYEHLPPHLAEVSQPFGEMARWVVISLPAGPERTTCLRKLLEAKDCAVRTLIAT